MRRAYCPPRVRTMISLSEIAGVAMITSLMSFLAICATPGPAVTT